MKPFKERDVSIGRHDETGPEKGDGQKSLKRRRADMKELKKKRIRV